MNHFGVCRHVRLGSRNARPFAHKFAARCAAEKTNAIHLGADAPCAAKRAVGKGGVLPTRIAGLCAARCAVDTKKLLLERGSFKEDTLAQCRLRSSFGSLCFCFFKVFHRAKHDGLVMIKFRLQFTIKASLA